MDKDILLQLRQEIDNIDDEIIPLLEKRFELIQKIMKEKHFLSDKDREEFILSKCTSNYSKAIFNHIFKESKLYFLKQKN